MNISLRPIEDGDLDAVYLQVTDPESIRMAAFTAEDQTDRRAFLDRMSRVRADPSVSNHVIDVDGAVAGTIASFRVDGEPEVTYWVDRAYWGKGIASAALQLLLAELTERPLYARAASDNVASLRVLEKAGFRRVGVNRDFAPGRGEEIEETILRLDSAPGGGVVLVEGTSDRLAVETLARRRGRDLQAEGIAVVPMGGFGNLPRLLPQYGDIPMAGLYDVGEERHFLRALGCADRGELERVGFYACTRDLEDELTRAVGPDGMEQVLAEQGELRAFRTYQKQPAHRARPLEEQLHGFMWNRKQRYAVLLVEALDLARIPRPLDRVMARIPPGMSRV